jgi:hypothetical protein
VRITLAITLFWAIWPAWPGMVVVRAADTPPLAPLSVEVEQGDGTVTSGLLKRIDAAGVQLVAGDRGGAVSLPGERVRAVRRTAGQPQGTDGQPQGTDGQPEGTDGRPKLVLTLVDGSTLSGDDVAWDGKQPAVLIRPEGRIELPAGRVRSIAWLPEVIAGGAAASWQGAIPEGTEKDLVVVGTAENHEFVECAITGVSADTVTVVLEDETIPVKRSKVIGLQWLRSEPAAAANGAGRALVAVSGGGVRASRVEWSADGLVVDGEIRLPSAMFLGVDYAAGRLVRLASLTAEKVDVEPWFGGLVRNAGRNDPLAAFFAPRTIDSGGVDATPLPPTAKRVDAGTSAAGIIMRPRTVSVWRLPPDSRRFRTVVAAAAGDQAADATMVTVAIDDREVFRQQVGGGVTGAGVDRDPVREPPSEGVPIDVDLASGRRLTVTVDFLTGGGIGGAVQFTDPVIER